MRDAYLLQGKSIVDPRGKLTVMEAMEHVPFSIRRVYTITKTQPETQRGFHAHKQAVQAVFCLHGSVRFTLDDGKDRESYLLDSEEKGLYIGKMIWREMSDFEDDAVVLVLSAEHYDASDYIRDREEFDRLVKEGED